MEIINKLENEEVLTNKNKITGYLYKSENAKGLIFFAPGITETMDTKFYKELITTLNSEGFTVIAYDHMGHGHSGETKMYFEKRNNNSGWETACNDITDIIELFTNKYTELDKLPKYAIGFSMGSFLIRTILINKPNLFKKCILVGTGYQSATTTNIGTFIANLAIKKDGAKNLSKIATKILLTSYGKGNWIYDLEEDWNEYLNNPYCSHFITAGLMKDFMQGMKLCCDFENIQKMNKKVPILLLSGKNDPVGNFTKGVIKFEKLLTKANINVISKFYEGKHNILKNSSVIKDIIEFLKTENNLK